MGANFMVVLMSLNEFFQPRFGEKRTFFSRKPVTFFLCHNGVVKGLNNPEDINFFSSFFLTSPSLYICRHKRTNFLMARSKTSKLTLSVHAGSKGDPLYHGLATPI